MDERADGHRRQAGDRVGGRRLPIGADVDPSGGVHFRVWAPRHRSVEVVLRSGPGEGRTISLDREANGYFSRLVPEAGVGTRYAYRLGGADGPVRPDPTSRFQPDGIDGPAEVIDPSAFRWTDGGWSGIRSPEGQILYELHVGTFTPEGTWASAIEQLAYVADLGVTVIEVMPVCEFRGNFGWGYDGVLQYAPFRGYGRPDDFRRFVDRAHALGLAVILDLVYNHLGPGGEMFGEFSDVFFSRKHKSEWGDSPNFDDEGSGPVRDYFAGNAAYWAHEFHLDGARIDATQSLYDTGPDHIVGAIARRMREAAVGRRLLIVGENESQHARLLRDPKRGGLGYDMLWSDDFHHVARVAATGRREGYLGDYLGSPQELVSALKRGWLYQGQWNLRQGKRRGTPAFDIPPWAFVNYLQNHDQIANTGTGRRLHDLTSPGRFRAVTAMQLLGPATPLLFQGQEWSASSVFQYFSDQDPAKADEMDRGRKEFLGQFPNLATPEMQRRIAHPADRSTFELSKLDPTERDRRPHAESLVLHRDLLRLRREDATIRAGSRPGGVDGAVLGPEAIALRWFDPAGQGDDRLLLANLGTELHLPVVAEPLLAPVEGQRWRILWSSEDPRYGGSGTAEPESEDHNWRLPAHAAILLRPTASDADEHRDPAGTA